MENRDFLNATDETIHSVVIAWLSEKLFHKFNNMICIVMANLDYINKQIKTDSQPDTEIAGETLQAISEFNKISELYAFIVKTSVLGNRVLDLPASLEKLGTFLNAGVIKNISFRNHTKNIHYCSSGFISSLFFLVLHVLEIIIEKNKILSAIRISAEKKDLSLDISFEMETENACLQKLADLLPNTGTADFHISLLSNKIDRIKGKSSYEKKTGMLKFTIPMEEQKNGQKNQGPDSR